MWEIFLGSVNLERGKAGGLPLADFNFLCLDFLSLDSLVLNPWV